MFLSQYAQNIAICSLAPTWYLHIDMRVPDMLGALTAKIALARYPCPGSQCLQNRLIAPILAGSLRQYRWPHCSGIVERYSWNHASSWRQTSTVPCTKLAPRQCVCLELCIFSPCCHEHRYNVPQTTTKRRHDHNRSITTAAASSLNCSPFGIVIGGSFSW